MKTLSYYVTLIVFLLQALIPVGLMPSFADDGATLVICSGVTGEAVQIRYDGGNPLDNHDHDEDAASHCPYLTIGAYTGTASPDMSFLTLPAIVSHDRVDDVFAPSEVIQSNHTRGPPRLSLS